MSTMPADDSSLRTAVLGAGYPIVPSEGATEVAIYMLHGARHLRSGLIERGIPLAPTGVSVAASTAALAWIDLMQERVEALDRLLDEHGGREANETLADAVKRALAALTDRLNDAKGEATKWHVTVHRVRGIVGALDSESVTDALDRVLSGHRAEIARLRTESDAVARSVAAKDAEIAGLRSDVRAAERMYEHAIGTVNECSKVANAHGWRAHETLSAALERVIGDKKAEIAARSRRIEELRVAGESLSTVMGQLSAAEADLAQEKARAAKAEAEVDRLRENARATNAHANIATCFGNGFVEAMEAHGVPLHDQNPLGLRRILGERSALEGDLVREQGRAEKLCADHKRQIDGLWTQITDGATREELLRGRAQKAEADVARLSAPVDDDAIALARCKIGLALYDANRGIAGNALCDGYLKTGDAALQKAIADILRSLVRQAPNAVADDEGKRLLAGIDAAIKQIEKEAAEWHVGATKCATQTYPGPDYAEAARSDNRADALERAAWLIGYHTKTKR